MNRAAVVDRPSTPVVYHAIGWLPTHRPREVWRELVLEFPDQAVVTNGMVADWAIRALADEDGRWIRRAHAHILLTHRFRRPGRRAGDPNPAWCDSLNRRASLAAGWAAAIHRHG